MSPGRRKRRPATRVCGRGESSGSEGAEPADAGVRAAAAGAAAGGRDREVRGEQLRGTSEVPFTLAKGPVFSLTFKTLARCMPFGLLLFVRF